MADTTHDWGADTAPKASVKLADEVPASVVQEMTERMADLVADSAARYFNGDIKAAWPLKPFCSNRWRAILPRTIPSALSQQTFCWTQPYQGSS